MRTYIVVNWLLVACRVRFPLGVGVGVGAAPDGLGCLCDGHGLPTGYGRAGGRRTSSTSRRVHDLVGGTPALPRAFLEQSDAVGVVGVAEVGQVDQLGSCIAAARATIRRGRGPLC